MKQEQLLSEFKSHMYLLRAVAELVMESQFHVVPAARPMTVDMAEAVADLSHAYDRLCSDLEAEPEDDGDRP